MTNEENKIQQRMRPLVLATIDREGAYATAVGLLRYQKLKFLSPTRLGLILERVAEGENFDTIIDKLILNPET